MFSRKMTQILVGVGFLAWLRSPSVAQCPPAQSSHVGATNGSQCNGVHVDWNTVSGATHYEIFRSTSQGTQGVHIAVMCRNRQYSNSSRKCPSGSSNSTSSGTMYWRPCSPCRG